MKPEAYFRINSKAAVAFSGGVDSAYLLYVAVKSGASVGAYYVKSAFQPQFELDDALRLTKELGVKLQVIPLDILCDDVITANPSDRCYYCKKKLLMAIWKAAKADGFDVLLDGTNASDNALDRPGMKVLKELSVYSPLREWGLTKDDIRRLSKEAGLFTCDKPAYACLATRIATGEAITQEKLRNVEAAENRLKDFGLQDFRVRTQGNCAKLQVRATDLDNVIYNREAILTELKKYYSTVVLDLEVRT